jgi:hypothetical protein
VQPNTWPQLQPGIGEIVKEPQTTTGSFWFEGCEIARTNLSFYSDISNTWNWWFYEKSKTTPNTA